MARWLAAALLASQMYSVETAPADARRQLGGEASSGHMLSSLSYVSSYEIVSTFPHAQGAFTQGLAFAPDGTLYESDGLYGRSTIRKIDVQTGKTTHETKMASMYFGEGAVIHGGKLIQLCWKKDKIFEYSLPDLKKIREVTVRIGREGWGLASDGNRLYLTDSGTQLFVIKPNTYEIEKTVQIADPKLGKSIFGVNELEWVGGELWGNVYPLYQHKYSECIVRFNASTGEVRGWIDMHGLFDQQRQAVRSRPHNYVLNGIAYHEASHRLYVTGKEWDFMYQVRITPMPSLNADHVLEKCNLG